MENQERKKSVESVMVGEWQWGITILASTYTPLEANDHDLIVKNVHQEFLGITLRRGSR